TSVAMDQYGGRVLTRSEYVAMVQDQQQQDDYAFEHSSLWSRLSDTHESRSFISQLAMASPSTSGQVSAQLASFGSLFNVGTLFSGIFSHPVSAQTRTFNDIPELDIMKLTEKGIPAGDPIYAELSRDPQGAWQRHNCDDPNVDKDWGDKKIQNPDTGEWEAHT